MTIGGALSELNNLLKADDIPIYYKPSIKAVMDTIVLSSSENPNKWIPVSEKYEHHIDHTDCIWYGSNSGCPVTCSQYRDGWNDAMDYIFKNGAGYQPYRRNENG